MRKQKAALSLLLAALLAFPAGSAPALTTTVTPPISVEAAAKKIKITNLTTGALTLEKGETFQLQANRTDVTWKSSNKKIVSVSKTGKLKGHKNGTATITVSAGNRKAVIEVTVGTKVTSVNVVKPAVALTIGAQSTIKAAVSPANASNQSLTYQSADTAVASVSKAGVITAKGIGKTKITVQASDGTGQKTAITVTVRATDSSVRLQDDFYQAINATRLKDHALSENEAQWNGFTELQNNITKNLSGIIDSLVAQKDQYADGTMEQKIIDFYLLARDMEARDKAGIEPLKPYIDTVDQAQTIDEYVEVLAELEKNGAASLLTFQIAQDTMDSNKYSLTDAGPTYILPKDYLVDEANLPVQQAVQAFIKQIFILAGESDATAAQIASQVFQLEQEFAAAGLGLADRYDVTKMYHPYTKEELKALYSNCDIEAFLKTVGITDFDQCIVREEENAKKVNSYLTPEHLDLLKNYTKFTLYMQYSSYLTSAHVQAVNDLNYMISGEKGKDNMDTVAKEMTQGLFSWEFGKLYCEQYFSEKNKADIEAMTHKLIETFRSRIQKLDWLSDETKQKAEKKLDTMKVKIGYPDKWPSYFDGITIDASKGIVENIMRISEATNANAQKLLDSGVDKTEWIMTPQTVNACYNPQANDITFPAAILQAPFYDENASYAQNLGAIGTVIGHEITHAFDTSGSQYDENGNFYNWWTETDLAEFTARAQKVKDYYNSIEITNGLFQNGDMTITENIADMGGMACVLEIAGDDKQAILDVFKGNANIWASNQTDQFRDYLLTVDNHSLDKIRVNAVVPLFDQFYDVFGVTKNDAMYVAPKNRIQIW